MVPQHLRTVIRSPVQIMERHLNIAVQKRIFTNGVKIGLEMYATHKSSINESHFYEGIFSIIDALNIVITCSV